MKFLLSLCFVLVALFASCGKDSEIKQAVKSIEQHNPFNYNLDVRYKIGNQTILLLSHEFSGNSQKIIDRVSPYTSDTLISFNYIDHDFTHETGDDKKTVMATPLEIMPLMYMLKECAVENNMPAISLYGYGLGAGNIILALDLLTKDELSELEKKYNITLSDKKRILDALRKGKILLDSPFKSLDAIIELHGINENLLMYKERMARYNISDPLGTLAKLKQLDMTFIVFFDSNDQATSTRDDSLFAKRLLDANPKGETIVIKSDNGGYQADHKTLWKVYSSL